MGHANGEPEKGFSEWGVIDQQSLLLPHGLSLGGGLRDWENGTLSRCMGRGYSYDGQPSDRGNGERDYSVGR
jgi:hypothetical protein